LKADSRGLVSFLDSEQPPRATAAEHAQQSAVAPRAELAEVKGQRAQTGKCCSANEDGSARGRNCKAKQIFLQTAQHARRGGQRSTRLNINAAGPVPTAEVSLELKPAAGAHNTAE